MPDLLKNIETARTHWMSVLAQTTDPSEASTAAENLRRWNSMAAWVDAWAAHTPTDPLPEMPAALRAAPRHQRRATNCREAVLEAVEGAIREAGQPLPIRELHEAVEARGVILVGGDPRTVLSTILWRARARVRKTDAGYSLD